MANSNVSVHLQRRFFFNLNQEEALIFQCKPILGELLYLSITGIVYNTLLFEYRNATYFLIKVIAWTC